MTFQTRLRPSIFLTTYANTEWLRSIVLAFCFIYSLFCIITAYFRIGKKLSEDDGNEFIEKAENYILTEIMKVKLRSFVITTSDYREKVRILRPMMLDSAKQFETVFKYDDLRLTKNESWKLIKKWLSSFRSLEKHLELDPISKDKEPFIKKCFSDEIYELKKRG